MIVINTKFLSQKLTGVHRYSIELCKHLPNRLGEHEIVLAGPKDAVMIDELSHFRFEQFGKLKGNLWEQFELPAFLKKNGSPLLINFSGISPVFYSNKILYIHDLAYMHHPEWFSKSFGMAYNLLLPYAARKAKKVFTVSEYSKQDIAHNYKLSPEKVEVVYAAASEKFVNLNLEKDNFVLMVSSLDPRKNMKRAIEAFIKVETDYRLIIIGDKMKSFSNPDLEKFSNEERIVFTGYLSDDELRNYYNRAKIFLYPSLFEGFGIPPMEAQKCGCPAIVSEITCLPEVYEDSVFYCDPFETDSIKNAIEQLISNEDLQKDLIRKGFENAKRFSWEKSAEVFRNLLSLVVL